jgi:hypothetical protein
VIQLSHHTQDAITEELLCYLADISTNKEERNRGSLNITCLSREKGAAEQDTLEKTRTNGRYFSDSQT